MKWKYLALAWVANTCFRYEPFNFQFGRFSENHTSYACGQAASYIFLLLFVQEGRINEKWQQVLYAVTMASACSNMADEIFFDPIHFGINEVIIPVIAFIITYHKLYKKNA